MIGKRTICLIIFLFLLIIIIQSLVYNYVYNKGKKMNGVIVLPDIIHDNFKQSKICGKISDITSGLLITFVLAFFTIIQKYEYIITFIILLIFVQFVCIISFSATVLPDAKEGDCLHSKNIFEGMVNLGSCNCLNISGHLLTIGLSLYIISMYQNHQYLWYYITVYVTSFFMITVSRNHYTIDCVNSTIALLLILTHKDNIFKFIEQITKEKLLI